MIQDPDHEIVSRAKSGDKAAFGVLVTRYYDMVYGLAYGVLNQREMALDAAQEVFIKVFRDLNRFEGRSKFKTWLYRVAVNMAIDFHRRKRPMESIDPTDESTEDDKAPEIVVDPKPLPRDFAVQSELKVQFTEALSQLTPDHRAILVLREWDGLSYEEIAETLGLELGTVMSRLFYARKKLSDVLAPKVKREEI